MTLSKFIAIQHKIKAEGLDQYIDNEDVIKYYLTNCLWIMIPNDFKTATTTTESIVKMIDDEFKTDKKYAFSITKIVEEDTLREKGEMDDFLHIRLTAVKY